MKALFPYSLFASLLLLVVNLSHGKELLRPKIVGGHDAGSSPQWMVQVFAGQRLCGGVLVAPEWVLTAAHCTYSEADADKQIPAHAIRVIVGEYSALEKDNHLSLAISERYQHPDYVDQSGGGIIYDNDISLLRLASPLSAERVYPLLNGRDIAQDYSAGIELDVIGFGRTNTNPLQPEFPEVLQQVSLPLLLDSQCAQSWGAASLSDNMFCTYAEGRDACMGDSGSPIFIDEGDQERILGLVSWGTNQCQTRPGVYADMGTLCEWAAETATLAGADSIRCSDNAGNTRGGSMGLYASLLLLLAWRFRR